MADIPYPQFRNCVRNQWGGIEMEIFHLGEWMRYSANPGDGEINANGRAMLAAAEAAGNVADYVPPTPEEVRRDMPVLSPRQLRYGLLNNGITAAQVETVIEAMPEGVDKEKARIDWEFAPWYARTYPLIDAIGQALSLSAEQIDTMWIEASNV